MQIRVCLLLAALCACFGLGLSAEAPTTQKTKIIPIVNDTPKEVTDVPIIKEEPISSVTEPSPKPDTPATEPITEPLTEPTTEPITEPPTTPPTPPPTPPPAPTPAPPAPVPGPPEQGMWSYTNKTDNVTCVLIQFAAQLQVTYNLANTSNLTASVTLNVPANASVTAGACDAEEQFIQLSWPVRNSTDTNTMTLNYHKNKDTKMYALKSLEFQLSPDQFVNATTKNVTVLRHSDAEWQVPLSSSYRCTPASKLNLTAAQGAVASLTISRLQEEAFRTAANNNFSAGRECGSSDVPDAVPIAVGCALGGLVLVVLVAYLAARRRSYTQGYLSM